jgi:ABC-type antimicrobial peptide transport system permease subunit
LSQTYPNLSETLFPEQVDPMSRMSDLEITDLALVAEYYRLYNSGNLTAAKQLILSNPQLNNKLFNAQKFNQLIDAVVAVQQFFKDNVVDYIEVQKGEIQTISSKAKDDINKIVSDSYNLFNNFVDEFTDKGDYSSTTQYKKKNIVQYLKCAYICKIDCIGQPPVYDDSNTYWQIVARGVKGESGTGLAPRGVWENSVQYYKDDCVSYNDTIWQCLSDNINSLPSDTNTDWLKMLSGINSLKGITWGAFVQ